MSSLLDPNGSSTKRKLESDFDDDTSMTTSANHSRNNQDSSLSKISKLEHHLLEGEMKASLVKLITLEQQLAAEKLERQKLENEFTSYKEKQISDTKLLQEQKKQLEESLKSSKLNEKLISGEMEHLRKATEQYERISIPEKDKEIEKLKTELKNLKDETKSDKSDLEAENTKLKFDLEAKTADISRLQEDVNILNEMVKSNKDTVSKLGELRNENSLLKNQLRDAEVELGKLREADGSNLNKFMDQSSRISDLERENRSLKTEVDYLRAVKEKSHLFQEELESKKKQIERYDKKLIDLELEKLSLQDELKALKETFESQNAANSQEELRNTITELKSELTKSKEKLRESNDERKKLKSDLNGKEDEVNDLQRRLTRTITERNGYKKIIEMSEETKYAPDGETKLLRKRVEELEIILSTYKKMVKESDEIKLGDNASFRFENIDLKCAEVQVNLNLEIYSEYEKKIQQLKDSLEEKQSSKRELAVSNETAATDEEKENSKVLEIKLNEQIRFSQQIKNEYMRRAKEIAKKVNILLGFHVSFEDDDIKLTDKSDPKNFLIFQSKPNGSISLKESDYYKSYSYLVNSHLRPFKSYIVFLAAVYCDSNGLKLDVTEKSFL